jgi:hypothetical protein
MMALLMAILAGVSLGVIWVLLTRLDYTVLSSMNFGGTFKEAVKGHIPGVNSGGEGSSLTPRGLEINYRTGEIISNSRPSDEHIRSAIRPRK